MTKFTECPNCGTKLITNAIYNVSLVSESLTKIINEYNENIKDAYCTKCIGSLSNFKAEFLSEKKELTDQFESLMNYIPIISTHSPLNWDYDILSIVTGQSTTGTGVISEFTSTFTDMFGLQSSRYNKKLKAGEDICFAMLRKQTLDLGGNAIIATDIDYSEVGGGKGMLMVCMGGTAIRLKNYSILGKEKAENIEKLITINDRLNYLNSLGGTVI